MIARPAEKSTSMARTYPGQPDRGVVTHARIRVGVAAFAAFRAGSRPREGASTLSTFEGIEVNPTLEKFGYPATLLVELDHWAILLRREQVTLGSLVLAAKSDAVRYSELPPEAFAEQGKAVRRIERALAAASRRSIT